jgi:hypothetical protein
MRKGRFREKQISKVLKEHLPSCWLVGLHPKTYRYASKRSGDEGLRKRLRELRDSSNLGTLVP